MKFVFGFPVSLAAEHLAMVGELRRVNQCSEIHQWWAVCVPSRYRVGKEEVLDDFGE